MRINSSWYEKAKEAIQEMIDDKISDAFEMALETYRFDINLEEKIEESVNDFDYDEAITAMIEGEIDIDEMVGEAIADIIGY